MFTNKLFKIQRYLKKGLRNGTLSVRNFNFAIIILSLSIAITVSVYLISRKHLKTTAEQRFKLHSVEIIDAIKFRMLFYEQALWGGVGLFNAGEEVTRKEFEAYVKALGIERHLPGIQGIGYSLPLSQDEKEPHIASIRKEGFPDFTIRPEGVRDSYTSIKYLEPFDWRNKRAFGYDMWSNDMRRIAMKRAMTTGKAANSGIITLVQETKEDVQRGFLMYLPVYDKNLPQTTDEEREKALQGWVYSPFRAGDLMNGVLNEADTDYGIEVYDGEEMSLESLLFDSDSFCHLTDPAYDPTFKEIIPLELQGRKWNVYIHTKPDILLKEEGNLPFYMKFFGIIVDLILLYVMFSLYRLRNKAEKLNDDLQNQKENLERANKELSQFAYIASHDLQEPLRTISNYSLVLKEDYEDSIDEEGKSFIKTIISATNRMDNLIHSILEYSRIGKLDRKFEKIDTQELISEIVTDMGGLILENRTALIYKDLPEIYGNTEMMRQLFSNLITNAIKYRKEGVDPVIKITAEEKSNSYEFAIADNGIGIEEQYHDRIFQIFQRLHDKTLYTGTGIGLSSCKKIIELHNGTIKVESELGKGSTFLFTILKEQI